MSMVGEGKVGIGAPRVAWILENPEQGIWLHSLHLAPLGLLLLNDKQLMNCLFRTSLLESRSDEE